MGFLDKVKDTATKVQDQAKRGVETGKDKIEDAQRRKQVEGLEREIGALVVAQRRGSAPADVDAQIDGKVARIAELEAEIAADDAPDTSDTTHTPGDEAPEAGA